jgi:homoserine O-acetyltransferase
LFFSAGDFPLESGKILPDLRIGYRTFGTLNADKSNAILFPTWFNGKSTDLDRYVTGEQAFVDPSKYFIIAVDALGNGVSAPARKGTFPRITIGDMVKSQHLLITKLWGIQRLHGVIGISMGAMQAFEWRGRYPQMVPRFISIVGTPRMTARDAILWTAFVNKGMGEKPADQDTKTESPKKKSSQIEGILGGILGRVGGGGGGGGGIPMPQNVLKQFDAMIAHNATQHFGNSLERFAKEAGQNSLVIIATKDEAVSNELPYEFVKLAGSVVVNLEGAGHNGFKTEQPKIRAATLPFFDDKTPAPPPPAKPQGNSIFAPPCI